MTDPMYEKLGLSTERTEGNWDTRLLRIVYQLSSAWMYVGLPVKGHLVYYTNKASLTPLSKEGLHNVDYLCDRCIMLLSLQVIL